MPKRGGVLQVVSTVQHTGKGFTVTIYLPKSAADADATVSLQWCVLKLLVSQPVEEEPLKCPNTHS